MRSFIGMSMILASFSSAVAGDYTEVRDLTLDTTGIREFVVDAGAGSLDIKGVDGLNHVEVKATIVIPDTDGDDAKEIIAKDLKLILERDGDAVKLTSVFDSRFWGGSNGRIDLEVRAPKALALSIDDGSGSMDVSDFRATVRIDDGSGSIDVRNVGDLDINDGSGSIDVDGASGDVHIEDGSGGITIEAVGGTVTIDDGSGSIRVSDVAKDLILLDDGSGSFNYSDVRGTVKGDI